jgi:hypothetical protein
VTRDPDHPQAPVPGSALSRCRPPGHDRAVRLAVLALVLLSGCIPGLTGQSAFSLPAGETRMVVMGGGGLPLAPGNEPTPDDDQRYRAALFSSALLAAQLEHGLGHGLQVQVLLGYLPVAGGTVGLGAKWQLLDVAREDVGVGLALVGDARAQGGCLCSNKSQGDEVLFGGARVQGDLLLGVRWGAYSLSAGPRAALSVGGSSDRDQPEETAIRELGGVVHVGLHAWFVESSLTWAQADGWQDGAVLVLGVGWRGAD